MVLVRKRVQLAASIEPVPGGAISEERGASWSARTRVLRRLGPLEFHKSSHEMERGEGWYYETRIAQSLVAGLRLEAERAQAMGRGGPDSYRFRSTVATASTLRREVEAAVARAASLAFALDWRHHVVSRLGDLDIPPDAKYLAYEVGDRGPPIHLDTTLTSNGRQVINALVYLNDDFEGGETVLDAAATEPLVVAPEAGKLVLWRSLRYDGPSVRVDRRALHTARPVTRGTKLILAMSIRAFSRPRATPSYSTGGDGSHEVDEEGKGTAH